jgi:hypothetical protein
MFDCVACPVADVVASPVLTGGGGSPPAPTGLVLEMQTTGAAETITLPITGSVDVTVDWGDGSSPEAFTTDSPSHEYATADTYEIKVTGSSDAFGFNTGGDEDKLISVAGVTGFDASDWSGAFYGANNLTSIDLTGIGAVTGFNAAIRNCSSLTFVDWGDLDVSGINVGTLGAFAFGTASLTALDVTPFENIAWVTFLRTFDGTGITSMDVSGFDTSSASDIREMFDNASSIVLTGLDTWDVTSLTQADSFLRNANNALSTSAYDAVLVAWEAQAVNNSVSIHFGDATYTTGSAADTARTALANDHLWTITDGGGV